MYSLLLEGIARPEALEMCWVGEVERYGEEPGVKVIISRFMKIEYNPQEVHGPRLRQFSHGLLYKYVGVRSR